jgi:hypothetical protein
MGWKTDFYNAVLEYVNAYLIDEKAEKAVRVTDVYDRAYAYENSYGAADCDYQVDISYKTSDDKNHYVTYYGSFSSLIEMLTN